MADEAGLESSKKASGRDRLGRTVVANKAALTAALARLSRAGFAPPPRLIFALGAREIPVLISSIRMLEEVRPSLAAPRSFALPRSIGAFTLGENLTADLIALPLEPSFAPLWPLALAGAVVVVQVRDDTASSALAAVCAEAHVPLVDATTLVSPIDLGSPVHAARLVAGAVWGARGT